LALQRVVLKIFLRQFPTISTDEEVDGFKDWGARQGLGYQRQRLRSNGTTGEGCAYGRLTEACLARKLRRRQAAARHLSTKADRIDDNAHWAYRVHARPLPPRISHPSWTGAMGLAAPHAESAGGRTRTVRSA
jgi:hypothetical protein